MCLGYPRLMYVNVIYHNILYYIILYHIISYYVILCHIISYYIILYHIISYYIILYHIMYHIISYYVSYYIILYIILYHIISYYIILYSGTPKREGGRKKCNLHFLRPPHFHRSLRVWCIPGECLEIALTRTIPRGVRTYIFHPSKT